MAALGGEAENWAFLASGGEAGQLISARDWSATALGPRRDWPSSLRTMLSFLLRSPVPIVMLWGEDGVMLYNDAYSVFAGGRHPEQLGMKVREGWPEVADFNDNVMRVGLAGGTLAYRDQELTLYRHGTPEQVFMNLDYSPVPGDDGAPAGVVAIVVETTERVRAERRREALIELDGRLRDLADTANMSFAASELLGRALGADRVGYGVLDSRTRTVVVERNWSAPGFIDVAGVHRFAEYGSYASELLRGTAVANEDVEDDPRTAASAGSFRAIGIRAHLDVPVTEDGHAVAQMFIHSAVPRKWTSEEIAFVRDFATRTRGAIARRTAEQELRTSEAQQSETAERLRLAIENAEVGFWDVDPVADTLIWPARTKAMFGISPDVPVTMQDFYDGLHPDDRPATSEAYAAAADPTRRALYDVEYRTVGREDGRVRWVAAKGRGVFDGDGRCIRVVGTAVDITLRKHAEEQLRELNETLEARVRERTDELEAAHQQLRQSQKLEAMGSLTGGVAHDFNNLLTPIVGALDLLQRRALGGEREQRLIAGAVQAAERAKTLVQRLLAFARRQPLQPVAVDLTLLVRNMADLVSSTTGPQIKVVVELADDLPQARADPNQLEMALLNLSVNARDAMPDGGTLRISANAHLLDAGDRPGLRAGRYLCLSVADTGTGMDEATIARAVEPFYSTKGVGKGTGLGLSMVHGLAAQLGGALAITSKVGLGTNVELWLPETDVVPDAPIPASHSAMVRGQGTALLVDDEDLVRLSTADMLTDLGYSVVETSCAEEALRTVQGGVPIDLVVTDHLMPGMTGTDLARALREHHPDLPVLVVSGYADVEGIAADLPRLTKPFRKDELASSLADLTASDKS